MNLITMNDYIQLLTLFKFDFKNYEIMEKPGTVCICFRKQRFRAWWYKGRLKKFIRYNKPVCTCVELAISMGWAV